MIDIQENYKEYKPPDRVIKSIKRLIKYTPKRYLSGLNLIHLTNSNALNRENRRNKSKWKNRKVQLHECKGWYSQKWQDNPAQIDLLIDNIYKGYPAWILRFNFFSDI